MTAEHPEASRPSVPRRIVIHRESTAQWELVCDGNSLCVEHITPSGRQRHSLEAFEASVDGQRLANSLTVALARAPHD